MENLNTIRIQNTLDNHLNFHVVFGFFCNYITTVSNLTLTFAFQNGFVAHDSYLWCFVLNGCFWNPTKLLFWTWHIPSTDFSWGPMEAGTWPPSFSGSFVFWLFIKHVTCKKKNKSGNLDLPRTLPLISRCSLVFALSGV